MLSGYYVETTYSRYYLDTIWILAVFCMNTVYYLDTYRNYVDTILYDTSRQFTMLYEISALYLGMAIFKQSRFECMGQMSAAALGSGKGNVLVLRHRETPADAYTFLAAVSKGFRVEYFRTSVIVGYFRTRFIVGYFRSSFVVGVFSF
jgi:hypothetical protein